MALGPILGPRVVIVGNSGSGKSTLAKVLAQRIAAPAIDLDPIHWQGRVGNERDEKLATDMVVEAAANPRWIIDGVWGELAAAALPFADTLIWLDLPWDVCRENLARRGPWKQANVEDYEDFLQWASLLAAHHADVVRRASGVVRGLFENQNQTWPAFGDRPLCFGLASMCGRNLINPPAFAKPCAGRH
jgi:adenylate kinase family enzyme